MCLLLVLFFIHFFCVNGFLLDNPQSNGGSLASSGQYVTVASFMDNKKLQEQEFAVQRQLVSQLRQDVDQSLALLASQIKDQLDTVVDEKKLNETLSSLFLLQRKYETLEQNHNQLKTEHTALRQQNTALESKMSVLETKLSQIIQLDHDLERLKNTTNSKADTQSHEISLIKNKTDEIAKQVTALYQLPNIKPLHEIDVLKQSMDALSKRTDTLTMKEQARSQDVLALYNMTVDTKSSFSDFRSKVNHDFSEMSANQSRFFTEIKQNQSSEISRLERNLEKRQNESMESIIRKIGETEQRVNETIELLQNEINNSTEEVAMTTFVQGLSLNSLYVGTIVKFSDVQFSVGIDNVSQFKSSGKFVCEKRGLYLVSTTLEFDSNDAEFHFYVNGNVYMKNYKHQQSIWWHSSSATIVLDLYPGDTVWVQIGGTATNVRGDQHSRFSIVKVK